MSKSYVLVNPEIVDATAGDPSTGTVWGEALETERLSNYNATLSTVAADMSFVYDQLGSASSDSLAYSWKDANTITVNAGSAISTDGTTHTVAAATDMTLADNLDTGTKAVSTKYYLWIGNNSVTGATALRFSLSATTPTNLLHAYKLQDYIMTDAAGNIVYFPGVLPNRVKFATDHNTVKIEMVSGVVTAATNANPIVITSTAHGRSTGDKIRIYGVGGNTNANNESLTITKIDANSFSIGVAGNGAYTSGGVWQWLDGAVVKAGGQVVSKDGVVSYTIPSDVYVSFAANLANGLSEAASTLYYFVIGRNSTGSDEIVLTTSESTTPNEHGSATALVHLAWCKWTLRNNSDLNVIPFKADGSTYLYVVPCRLDGTDKTEIYDASILGWSSVINFQGFCPTWGMPLVTANMDGGNGFSWRIADDAGFDEHCFTSGSSSIKIGYPMPNQGIQIAGWDAIARTMRASIKGYVV